MPSSTADQATNTLADASPGLCTTKQDPVLKSASTEAPSGLTPEQKKLFEEYQSWALGVGRRYPAPRQGLTEGQVEQAALIGLWRAVQRFRPGKIPFKSFAIKHLTGAIKDDLRNEGPIWTHRYHETTEVVGLTWDIAAKKAGTPEADSNDEVRKMCETLPDSMRDATVSVLANGEARSSVAKRLGVSTSRVSQLLMGGKKRIAAKKKKEMAKPKQTLREDYNPVIRDLLSACPKEWTYEQVQASCDVYWKAFGAYRDKKYAREIWCDEIKVQMGLKKRRKVGCLPSSVPPIKESL